jgi:hypothetical protein
MQLHADTHSQKGYVPACLQVDNSIPTPVTSHPRLLITAAQVPLLQSWAVSSNPMYINGFKPALTYALNRANSYWSWTFKGGLQCLLVQIKTPRTEASGHVLSTKHPSRFSSRGWLLGLGVLRTMWQGGRLPATAGICSQFTAADLLHCNEPSSCVSRRQGDPTPWLE